MKKVLYGLTILHMLAQLTFTQHSSLFVSVAGMLSLGYWIFSGAVAAVLLVLLFARMVRHEARCPAADMCMIACNVEYLCFFYGLCRGILP